MSVSESNHTPQKTALIVDDTPQNLTVLGQLLQLIYCILAANTLKGVSAQIGAKPLTNLAE